MAFDVGKRSASCASAVLRSAKAEVEAIMGKARKAQRLSVILVSFAGLCALCVAREVARPLVRMKPRDSASGTLVARAAAARAPGRVVTARASVLTS